MEHLKNYLESSTVHGLAYISTTRRLVRLFWILVIITGFTGAGSWGLFWDKFNTNGTLGYFARLLGLHHPDSLIQVLVLHTEDVLLNLTVNQA